MAFFLHKEKCLFRFLFFASHSPMFPHLKCLVLIIIAVFGCAVHTTAHQLTPAASLERFKRAEQAVAARAHRVVGSKLELTFTSRVADKTTFYVFSPTNSDGFLILAADDLAPEILGYAPNGNFDPNHLPDNFKYWLGELDRQISLAIESNTPLFSSTQHTTAAHAAPRKNIDPLLPCQWGQAAPYNDECPIIEGTRAYTGCVATAMAQIMFYHKYPANFDWEAMLHRHFPNSPARSNASVAQLMHACGQSIDMKYGIDGSSALSQVVMPALYRHFGYDGRGRYCPRYMYNDNEWTELLYTELAAARPIYYSGATSTTGHAFVIDGYEGGLFHVNWGWDGMCDGYYTVTGVDPLHPKEQGIGGSPVDEGFANQQDCIVGIQPPQGENVASICVVNTASNYQVYDVNGQQTDDFRIGAEGNIGTVGKFINLSNFNTDVYFGVKFVNQLTNRTFYTSVEDAHFYRLNIEQGTDIYPFTTANVPKGIYYIYPVVRSTSTSPWTDVELRPQTKIPYINIGSFNPSVSPAELACSTASLELQECADHTVAVTLSDVCNVAYDNFNFFGDITLGIYDSDEQLLEVLEADCTTIPATQLLPFEHLYPEPLTISATLPATLTDGHYLLTPMARHQYSTEWACFGTYFTSDGSYDMGLYHDILLDIENGTIRLRDAHGNDTDQNNASVPVVPLRPASALRSYSIDGRPSATHQGGIILTPSGTTYTKRLWQN